VGVGVGAEDGLSGGALVHPWKWCSCWSWRWFNGGRGAITLGSGARDGGGIVCVCCLCLLFVFVVCVCCGGRREAVDGVVGGLKMLVVREDGEACARRQWRT